MPFSTGASPNDLRRPSTWIALAPAPASRAGRRSRGRPGQPALPVPVDQPVGEPGQRDRQDQEQHRGHGVAGVVEHRAAVDLRRLVGLDRAEHADQRGVLLQADEVVQQRREDVAHRLRQDHEPQRGELGQAERPGGRGLAAVHRVEPGPVHLGHVRRVREHSATMP